MCLTEFDVESAIKTWREDGYEDGVTAGKQEKAVEAALILITDFNIEPKLAAEKMGIPLDKVLKALK